MNNKILITAIWIETKRKQGNIFPGTRWKLYQFHSDLSYLQTHENYIAAVAEKTGKPKEELHLITPFAFFIGGFPESIEALELPQIPFP